MRISDWSSDVCSSDLGGVFGVARSLFAFGAHLADQRLAIAREPVGDRRLETGRLARLDHRRIQLTLRTQRPEERSVGKYGVRTFRYRWSPVHLNTTIPIHNLLD